METNQQATNTLESNSNNQSKWTHELWERTQVIYGDEDEIEEEKTSGVSISLGDISLNLDGDFEEDEIKKICEIFNLGNLSINIERELELEKRKSKKLREAIDEIEITTNNDEIIAICRKGKRPVRKK